MVVKTDFKSRRNFIKSSIIAGSAISLMPSNIWAAAAVDSKVVKPLKVYIFSKHLQFLNYKDMADAAADIGFDGVDLTVRPNGHVLPERVEYDLPAAVAEISRAGLSKTIMTTAIQDATSSADRKVLETAAALGIEYYRMNWLKYSEGKSIPESINQFKHTISKLNALNKKLGLTGCYQNHSGNYAGASIWELWEMLKDTDNQHMGVQYDIRHAVVEGALSWMNGFQLIQPQIKFLAIKDFLWSKSNGKWNVENVPLGEGMIDYKTYFSLLKKYNMQLPVSLHFEYPVGGAEHGSTRLLIDRKIVFAAMKRDLQKLHRLWHEA